MFSRGFYWILNFQSILCCFYLISTTEGFELAEKMHASYGIVMITESVCVRSCVQYSIPIQKLVQDADLAGIFRDLWGGSSRDLL